MDHTSDISFKKSSSDWNVTNLETFCDEKTLGCVRNTVGFGVFGITRSDYQWNNIVTQKGIKSVKSTYYELD